MTRTKRSPLKCTRVSHALGINLYGMLFLGGADSPHCLQIATVAGTRLRPSTSSQGFQATSRQDNTLCGEAGHSRTKKHNPGTCHCHVSRLQHTLRPSLLFSRTSLCAYGHALRQWAAAAAVPPISGPVAQFHKSLKLQAAREQPVLEESPRLSRRSRTRPRADCSQIRTHVQGCKGGPASPAPSLESARRTEAGAVGLETTPSPPIMGISCDCLSCSCKGRRTTAARGAIIWRKIVFPHVLLSVPFN